LEDCQSSDSAARKKNPGCPSSYKDKANFIIVFKIVKVSTYNKFRKCKEIGCRQSLVNKSRTTMMEEREEGAAREGGRTKTLLMSSRA